MRFINHYKKLKSFTLSELVVVMIISLVVVGIAFSVLNLIEKHINSIQSNLSNQSHIEKLEMALTIDFNVYSELKYNADNIELLLSNPLGEIKYEFTREYVLRNSDTIQLKIKDLKTYKNGSIIENGFIDAIELFIDNGTMRNQLFVFKDNTATDYMN